MGPLVGHPTKIIYVSTDKTGNQKSEGLCRRTTSRCMKVLFPLPAMPTILNPPERNRGRSLVPEIGGVLRKSNRRKYQGV